MGGVRKRSDSSQGVKIRKSRRYYNKDGSLNTSGQQLLAKKQYKLDKKSATNRAEKRAAKNKYKKAVEDTYDKKYHYIDRSIDAGKLGKTAVNKINDKMKTGQSYGKAATMEYAKAYAKGIAACVAIYEGKKIRNVAVNSLYKNANQYAYQKAVQRANSGLARIGTFQYEKVAGDVFRKVMK